MSWTPERVSKLKELWGKGNTASQIAEIIGDVTRNAVIGKAHRLNLATKSIPKNSNSREQTKFKDSTNKNEKKTRKSRFKSLIIEKDFEPENPKTLEQLEDGICKWPIGHPDEEGFYFCGRHSISGFSYCKLHILYAFQPKNKKEDLIDKDDDVPQFIEKKIKSA